MSRPTFTTGQPREPRNPTFTTGQAPQGKPPRQRKWLGRLKWLWARRWGKALIGIFILLVVIVGLTPTEDETTEPTAKKAPTGQTARGVEVKNLTCADGLCAGSLKVDEDSADARVGEAARGIQWAFAEHADANRTALIVAGPNAATWVQCTRAQSDKATDDAEAIQDQCKVQRRSADVGLDADVAARGSQFDRPTEREVPELEKRLTSIKGLVDDPARLTAWAVDQCGTILGGGSQAALLRATRLRFSPGASDAFDDAQARRVISAVRDTFCDGK